MQERNKGTPQGSAVSPVLANLFLHYAFDMFLEREFPTVEFERYADDGVPRTLKEVPV
jgi:retron-type reverse transcriptase